MKDKGAIKDKEEGENLACQDSYDSEGGIMVMDPIADNHVESNI